MKKLFGGKRFWSALSTLALPVAVQNLLTSSFVLVDTLMVSSLGDVSLAAVGMAGQWSWLLNLALFGFSSGASVFFAQYFGDQNLSGIKKTYAIVMFFVIISALLFSGLGFLAPKMIISIFNRDSEVLSIGATYLKIAAFSYPAIVINQIVGVFLRSTGRAKLPMYIALFTTVLNAFLDYALIFGAFGFPALGISGAAIATCISAWTGPALILPVLIYQKDEVICMSPAEFFSFKMQDVKLFFERALPVLINEALWGLGTFTLNVIYSNMGYEYYAAMTILKTFDNILFAFFVGINNSCCIVVGQEIGAGRIETGFKDAKRYIAFVPAFAFLTAVFVIIFRHGVIDIFNTTGAITQLTLNTASEIMVIYAVLFPLRNFLYVIITGVFRSGGDTKTGMKYDLSCLWGISVPLTAIFAFVFRLPFALVYASPVFEEIVKCIFCIRHFVSQKWVMPVTETGKIAYEEYKRLHAK